MGPVALVELGGPDRSPNPLRDRRYLELLLPGGDRVALCLGWLTRRRPRCSDCAQLAETGISAGRGRPRPTGQRVLSGRPAGPLCREGSEKQTDFVSWGAVGYAASKSATQRST